VCPDGALKILLLILTRIYPSLSLGVPPVSPKVLSKLLWRDTGATFPWNAIWLYGAVPARRAQRGPNVRERARTYARIRNDETLLSIMTSPSAGAVGRCTHRAPTLHRPVGC